MFAHRTPLLWLFLSLWHFIPGFMGSVHACTHFTDDLPKAQSCIFQFLSWFLDPMGNMNFWGGAGISIFQDDPAWGRSYIKIFQVYPVLFCPQPSRLQLSHLVSCVITADVDCSWLNPPSILCPPNSLGQEGNPLPSLPTRSHSGGARSAPLSSGWL